MWTTSISGPTVRCRTCCAVSEQQSMPGTERHMHAFRKAALVALSLALIGTAGCSKNRSRDQDDDDDDDDDPAPAQQAPAAACRLGGPSVEAHWTDTIPAPSTAAPPLGVVADLALPGTASRFDYQRLQPASGRLFLSHMGAG